MNNILNRRMNIFTNFDKNTADDKLKLHYC